MILRGAPKLCWTLYVRKSNLRPSLPWLTAFCTTFSRRICFDEFPGSISRHHWTYHMLFDYNVIPQKKTCLNVCNILYAAKGGKIYSIEKFTTRHTWMTKRVYSTICETFIEIGITHVVSNVLTMRLLDSYSSCGLYQSLQGLLLAKASHPP